MSSRGRLGTPSSLQEAWERKLRERDVGESAKGTAHLKAGKARRQCAIDLSAKRQRPPRPPRPQRPSGQFKGDQDLSASL